MDDWFVAGSSKKRNKKMSSQKHYGFGSFLFDVIMTCFTAGFWLIWVFVREMRKNS